MRERKEYIIRISIIVLSVLLAVSLFLLAGILLYNRFYKFPPDAEAVTDNIITPEKEEPDTPQSNDSESGDAEEAEETTESASGGSSSNSLENAIVLRKRRSEDSLAFSVSNMFPGDSFVNRYAVHVSHLGDVVLRLRAEIHPGYDKLSEVLHVKVALPDSGEVLYNGLLRDMTESVNVSLDTAEKTTSETYYEITAYLDTSVGDEYANKELVADLIWWVEEVEYLFSPQTGDNFSTYLLVCVAAGSLFLLILLLKKREKEGETNER